MSGLAKRSIPLPEGFYKNTSSIQWWASVSIENGKFASGSSHNAAMLPVDGKASLVLRAHPKGGIVRITIFIEYKLDKAKELGPAVYPEPVEAGSFQFGCEWSYTYTNGQFAFGPAQKFALPPSQAFRLLQGTCDDIQSKDPGPGGANPFAYATAVLSLKSKPGEASSWSFQAPLVGGPSYTPPPESATPDGGFRLSSFQVELVVKAPDIDVNLDPSILQLMLVFENEKQPDISNARFLELRKWVETIKGSNLMPVIQKKTLHFYMQGHASRPGGDMDNFDLSDKRLQNVRKRFEGLMGMPVDIYPAPRGNKDALPADIKVKPHDRDKKYLYDRNVTIYIEQEEAKKALTQYYLEGGKQ